MENVDIELVFDRDIAAEGTIDRLETTLRRLAPRWASDLRVVRSARDQRRVVGRLRQVVVDAATERGGTFEALVAQYGPVVSRRFGSAELRGAGSELIVVVSIDSDPFWLIGGSMLMGNTVTLQIRRAKVDGRPAEQWAGLVLRELAAQTSPVWGAVCTQAEYHAKVMSDGPGVAAVGRDFARALPGLFAMNFFGRPYRELIGEQRLLSSPASTSQADDGVLVVVTEHPTSWDSEEAQTAASAVLDHLGRRYFYAKVDPPPQYAAPRWR